MTTIAIVDDHPLMRQGIRGTIERAGRHSVVGEASSVPEAQTLIARARPGLATIDLSLSQGHGLDLVRWLSASSPTCSALIVSMHDEAIYAERALRMGARGYLMKDRAADELGVAIERVLGGKTYLSPAMTERILERACGRPAGESPMGALTARELQVLELIGRGQGTVAIARALSVSVKTVETYRARLKEKLGLSGAAALTRYAVAWALER